MTSYSFVPTVAARPATTDGSNFDLVIRQQPARARVCCGFKERERRPVDPPPIIQLRVTGTQECPQNYLQSPSFFMCANLYDPYKDSVSSVASAEALAGTIVSSLYRLKDVDDTDAGFFIWGDISIKVEGIFRLKFSLFEVTNTKLNVEPRLEVTHIKSVLSHPFTVYSSKVFPGMGESTFLSRSFSDQGVRIKLRKEHRMQMKQSRASTDNIPRNKKEHDVLAVYAPLNHNSDQFMTDALVHSQDPVIQDEAMAQAEEDFTPQDLKARQQLSGMQTFSPYMQPNNAVEYNSAINAPGLSNAYKQNQQWFVPLPQASDRLPVQMSATSLHPTDDTRRIPFGHGLTDILFSQADDVSRSPRALQFNQVSTFSCDRPPQGLSIPYSPFLTSRRKSWLTPGESASVYPLESDQFQGITNHTEQETSRPRDQQHYIAPARHSDVESVVNRPYSLPSAYNESSQASLARSQYTATEYRSSMNENTEDGGSSYLSKTETGHGGTDDAIRDQQQDTVLVSDALKLPPLQITDQTNSMGVGTESTPTNGYSPLGPQTPYSHRC